jgi:hypothetical protein
MLYQSLNRDIPTLIAQEVTNPFVFCRSLTDDTNLPLSHSKSMNNSIANPTKQFGATVQMKQSCLIPDTQRAMIRVLGHDTFVLTTGSVMPQILLQIVRNGNTYYEPDPQQIKLYIQSPLGTEYPLIFYLC